MWYNITWHNITWYGGMVWSGLVWYNMHGITCCMPVSLKQMGVLFVGVLALRALVFGVYVRAPCLFLIFLKRRVMIHSTWLCLVILVIRVIAVLVGVLLVVLPPPRS